MTVLGTEDKKTKKRQLWPYLIWGIEEGKKDSEGEVKEEKSLEWDLGLYSPGLTYFIFCISSGSGGIRKVT